LKQYILTLSIASVISGFALLLCSSKLQKSLKLLVSLVMTVLIVSPFAGLRQNDIVSDAAGFAQSASDMAAQTVTDTAKDMAESYITESIYQKFGIKPISVCILYDSNSVRVVMPQGMADCDEVAAFAAALSGVEATAVYE